MMVFLISERRTIIYGNQFIVSTIKLRKCFFRIYDTDNTVGEVWPLNIYFER